MLKLDPTNTTLLAQKQKLLKESIAETKEKLETLNEANKKASESVKNYDAWAKAYEPIQKEIDETKTKITDLKSKMKEMEDVGDIDTDEYKKLKEELKTSSKELTALKKQAKETNDEFGNPVSTKQYDALQREIIETEKSLKSLQKQAETPSKLNVGLTNLGNAATNASQKTKGLSTAAGGLLAAMAATVPATEEYRENQAKLATAFEDAGSSAEAAKETYDDLQRVLGDDGQATEAASHLAELTQNQKSLSEWTDICQGIYAKFGDSLPIEGLTEASNETAKVGQVTGTLADALNWAGVSEEEFNKKLAECNNEAEREKLIRETLTGLYSEAAAEYEKNNEAVLKQRDAQAQLQEKLAALAEVITPLITQITEIAAKLIGMFTSLSPNMQMFIITLIAIVAAISPVLGAIGLLSTAIAGISAPILAIVAVIGVFVATITYLWNTNENFRIKIQEIWSSVQESIKKATETIKEIVNLFCQVVQILWSIFGDTIMGVLNNTVNMLINIFQNGLNIIKNVLKLFTSIFTGDWQGAWEAVKNIFSSLLDIIKTLFSTALKNLVTIITTLGPKVAAAVKGAFESAISFITSLPGEALTWGKDFIQGFVNGIKSKISSVINAVKNVASTITSWLHFSRPDVGPLREYETWMPDMMQGLSKGIIQNIPRIQKATKEVADVMYQQLQASPQFALASNPAVNINNAVSVRIGNKEFDSYITNTAQKGISKNQRNNMKARGK